MNGWMRIAPAAIALLLLAPARPARASEAEDRVASLQILSTGVGAEERQAPPPAGYRAKLIFANPMGEYLANVRVIIRLGNVGREVFSPGPWLYVKGVPGRYQVEARAGETSAHGVLDLPAGGMATVVLRLK